MRSKHDFSIRLEATKKDGVSRQVPRPAKMRPVPPQTVFSAARAQTRGGPQTPASSQQAPATHVSQTRPFTRAQETSTP